MRDSRGWPHHRPERNEFDTRLATARSVLDDAEFQRIWEDGESMFFTQTIEYALSDA